MTKRRRTTEEMFPVVEAYLGSGMTQRAFAEERGLPLQLFVYWLGRYRRLKQNSGGFVEIQAHSGSERPLVEVAYPSGVRLRFFSPVEPAYLERLLSA